MSAEASVGERMERRDRRDRTSGYLSCCGQSHFRGHAELCPRHHLNRPDAEKEMK